MASIRKRGPYQWEAQVRRQGYPAQSKTFNTKAEAEAWGKTIESEMVRGVWVSRGEAEATSFLDALDRYELEVVPSKRNATKELSLTRVLKGVSFAKRPLATIRSADVAKLRDEWLKNYKPASVLRYLAVISHVFNIARKEWGMESLSNPVELIRKPQPNNARTRRIQVAGHPSSGAVDEEETNRDMGDGELEHIVSASGSDILPSIIWLALETAMRRGELVQLRWEHVDLTRCVAHLPLTKNGSSRDVPLSTRAVQVLTSLKKEYDQKRDEDDEQSLESMDDSRVFKVRGDAVTRAFDRAVKRARKAYEHECEKAGRRLNAKYLTDLRFHDLRHEATTRLAEIFPMHELTKITGHKDPRMLMRYYHPRAEDLAKRLR